MASWRLPVILRDRLAVWAGKKTLQFSRRFGHGGSSLPGLVALRIQPAILNHLSADLRRGAVVITGTNGKTTTSRLLAAVLQEAEFALVHNRSGANLLPGLVSAFLERAASRGNPVADVALMEVDEATVPDAVRRLNPLGVVVTNFFRDQLDRYGELDTTVSTVGRGLDLLGKRAFVALNADDPLAASLGSSRTGRVVYYGLEDVSCGTPVMNQTREQRHCLRCGRPLVYDVFYYAHLGRYQCPAGDFERRVPDFAAKEVRLDGIVGSSFVLAAAGQAQATVRVPVPGLYNVYNALAALTAAIELGVEPARAAAALSRATACFGRMEGIVIDGRRLILALVKNPAGYNQVIRTLLDGPVPQGGRRFLMALNDKYADGTDISWIWDVDFEILARPAAGVAGVVASGTRAEDLALRLKYAGLPEGSVQTVSNLGRALDVSLEAVPEGATLFVTPTYTAMLELRDIISRRGLAPPFWETEAGSEA